MRQVLGCAGRRFGHVTMAAVRLPVMAVGLLRRAFPLMATFTLRHRWTVVLSSPMRSGGRAQSACLQERQDWIVCPVARRRSETTRGAVAAEEATPNPTAVGRFWSGGSIGFRLRFGSDNLCPAPAAQHSRCGADRPS